MESEWSAINWEKEDVRRKACREPSPVKVIGMGEGGVAGS